MVRNLLLICLSFSLVLGASGCNQNEDPAASDEQFAAVLAAPVAVGAWFTAETGLSIAALTALNTVYIQRTGATPGGFFWDILTMSHPQSRARLIGFFSRPNSREEVEVANVVMPAVKSSPTLRRGDVVKREVRELQSAECRQANASAPDGVAVAGAACTKKGLTCQTAIRSENNGRGGDNWRPGTCTCKESSNEAKKLHWGGCTDSDGNKVIYFVGEFTRVVAPRRFY
jgi:hypothetical protein